MPEEGVNQAEFPDILYDLWRCFLDLSATRGIGMSGILSITYQDIQAYCSVKMLKFEEWQLNAIRHIDNNYLNSQYEK